MDVFFISLLGIPDKNAKKFIVRISTDNRRRRTQKIFFFLCFPTPSDLLLSDYDDSIFWNQKVEMAFSGGEEKGNTFKWEQQKVVSIIRRSAYCFLLNEKRISGVAV